MEPLYKMVNGERVQMSDEETAAIRAEWEANANAPPPPPPTLEQLQAQLAAIQAQINALAGQP